MGWVWWLLAPLAVTSAAALLTWIAGRPRRPPTSEEAVSSHRRFLDDLADASAPAHRARAQNLQPGSGPPAAEQTPSSARPDKLPG
jgi:hypothetical protein